MPTYTALVDRLGAIADEVPGAVIANSLGMEDMLLVHAAAEAGLTLGVLVLETGRLHEQTLALLDTAMARYAGLNWDVRSPDSQALARIIQTDGVNGFRRSVAARQACCQARKVIPLNQALAGYPGWITGQRRAQSLTREALGLRETDGHGRLKFNPLANWSLKQVRASIDALDIPINPLHDQHFPSIGCAPCTRAISAGEDVRAGRWWWEQPDSKECGLHPL
ncbi:phosphoadenylyl-sulfate reductase [Litorivicinus lipolyticus]|uniref:phosphoadenylyl-sulfate reductase n=1 Tax=Litorivicinus lipolyticus TaxID=418701 RepID=UPI003B5913C0